MKKNEYKCEACGEIYEKGWTDEEAMEEADSIWGNELGDDPAIICDDCFQKGHQKIYNALPD